ncbi:hypothetical protein MRX96_058743 [Rhipicephalus microplus]
MSVCHSFPGGAAPGLAPADAVFAPPRLTRFRAAPGRRGFCAAPADAVFASPRLTQFGLCTFWLTPAGGPLTRSPCLFATVFPVVPHLGSPRQTRFFSPRLTRFLHRPG